jgi:hypothetical protein
MKAFSLLLVGVLFSTLVFANGTDEPNKSESSVAVTNSVGSSLFKLFYKAEQAGTVKVSIFSNDSKLVFSEKMKNANGFMRPYNFTGLPAGKYTIQIEDKNGIRTEQVEYTAGKIEKYISLVKIAEEGKYLLSINSKSSDTISVSIFDEFDQLIHKQDKTIEHNFAEVLNLKNINRFTIEVSDSQGLLKSVKN